MKRGTYILFFLVFILIIIPLVLSINVINKDITGNVITGDATNQVGMNIAVIAWFPLLSIIHPENETYIVNNYRDSSDAALIRRLSGNIGR